MKINPALLSLSSAVIVAILWTVYSAAVFSLTILAINLSGEMGYLNFSDFDWKHALIQFTGTLDCMERQCRTDGLANSCILQFLK